MLNACWDVCFFFLPYQLPLGRYFSGCLRSARASWAFVPFPSHPHLEQCRGTGGTGRCGDSAAGSALSCTV